MIFDPDALLQLAAQLAEKQAIPLPLTRETMSAIVDEAERLAGGDERDEPAALFYACALRAAAFGKIPQALSLSITWPGSPERPEPPGGLPEQKKLPP